MGVEMVGSTIILLLLSLENSSFIKIAPPPVNLMPLEKLKLCSKPPPLGR